MAMRHLVPLAGSLFLALLPPARAFAPGGPPSVFGVDAPELAPLGAFAVGVLTLRLVDRDQADPLAFDAASGSAPRRDRRVTVDLWYPARTTHRPRVRYAASFPAEPPRPPVSFTVPGIAVRDAPAAAQHLPLIIVSHGYSNDPAAMTWVTENLASKGYVVAGIHHEDPPITDRTRFAQPLLRRPLDIAFVARALHENLAASRLIDFERTALIGYSMGGYGVLTAAGASLDPQGAAVKLVPGGLLLPYARGGASRDALVVKGLRAVVAIAPAGGGALAAWGPYGLSSISVPLLLIAGDSDRTVDYASGARGMFDAAVNAPRYLLTFKGGGHSIGLNGAPEAMRSRLWDQDWFEDPVWRKERVNAINAHFITAFFDLYLKGDSSRAAYLDVAEIQSDAGVWPAAAPPPAYDAYSPGIAPVTLWKGFQAKHAAGLELLHALPGS
jgi:predicted dienelactone hydrolase